MPPSTPSSSVPRAESWEQTEANIAKRIVILMVSLVYGIVQSIARVTSSRPASGEIVVLTYHAVPPEEALRFRQQMRMLLQLATPVFADASASIPARRHVAITFDDALQSIFDHALPTMREYGIPATVFVPTAFVGGEPGWIPVHRRQGGTSSVLASTSTLAGADRRFVRFGSHTCTHPHLAELPPAVVEQELTQSRQMLHTITGSHATMLSFPFGSFDERVLEVAEQAGYTHLFANVPLETRLTGAAHLVGRVTTSPRDWPLEFRLKARGAYRWLTLAIPIKRSITSWFRRLRAS